MAGVQRERSVKSGLATSALHLLLPLVASKTAVDDLGVFGSVSNPNCNKLNTRLWLKCGTEKDWEPAMTRSALIT